MSVVGVFKDLVRRVRVWGIRSRARRLGEFAPAGRVLVIAPHPDDEVLGCGGVIARLVDAGRAPRVVILSKGEGSHAGCCGVSAEELKENRHGLTLKAAEILGLPAENVTVLDCHDGKLRGDLAEIGKLKDIIGECRPDTILVPHNGEGWNDHVMARKIGMELAPEGCAVWEYCVWFWYYVTAKCHWGNARVLKLTDKEREVKNRAVDAYVLPAAPCGRPWSGVLPGVMVGACRGDLELFFRT